MVQKTKENPYIMKNKLISSLLFFIFCVTFLHGQANLPPDDHECNFPSSEEDEHIASPTFEASATEGGPYDISGKESLDISISGNVINKEDGTHEITTTYSACSCGAAPPDPFTIPVNVSFGSLEYTWSFAGEEGAGTGDSFEDVVTVTDPGVYALSANFTGTSDKCPSCSHSASDTKEHWVFRLKFEGCTKWLGLDRTDEGEAIKKGEASVKLEPTPGEVEYDWSGGDPCELKNIVENEAEFWTKNTEDCSGSFDGSTLTVSVSGTDPTFSGTVETNFTVVKVDVTIDGVGEDKEESVGAFAKLDITDFSGKEYDPDDMGWLKPILITCKPEDLPDNEFVKISGGLIYELKDDGKLYLAKEEYVANTLKDRTFYLQGNSASQSLADKEIIVTHETSQAIDKAAFTVVNIILEPITSYPSHNSSGLAFGSTGSYVAKSIGPDEVRNAMTWKVEFGNISIASQSETSGNYVNGLMAYVTAGNAEGIFKLKLAMDTSDECFSTYNLPEPYIAGKTLEPKEVPVHVVLIEDGYGSVASMPSMSAINEVFEQVAMSFSIESVTHVVSPELWDYSPNSGWFVTELDLMKDLFADQYNGPGVLLVVVNEIVYGDYQCNGLCHSSTSGDMWGITLSSGESGAGVLPHEIGHYCRLVDIYCSLNNGGTTFSEEENILKEERLPLDWSGGAASGYYSYITKMESLDMKLLMNGNGTSGANGASTDIPFGNVFGFGVDNNTGMQLVGQVSMTRDLVTIAPDN